MVGLIPFWLSSHKDAEQAKDRNLHSTESPDHSSKTLASRGKEKAGVVEYLNPPKALLGSCLASDLLDGDGKPLGA